VGTCDYLSIEVNVTDYPILRNLLVSVMSVDVGLSEEREEAALVASFANLEYRNKLRQELEAAFLDESLSWVELLDNESYCVYSADSEDDAKQFMRDRLWARLASLD
jgi:hypothetical protein